MRLVLDARTASFGALIDYAGVFPPASLDLREAVHAYRRLRTSEHHWVVDRFLCRASQLEDLAMVATSEMTSAEEPWHVGVIADMAPGATATMCAAFASEMAPAMTITAVETRPAAASEEGISDAIEAIGSFDLEPALFIEVLPDESLDAQLDATADGLRSRGRSGGAKLRCGGLTAKAFPSVDDVVAFLVGTANRRLPFKATAGLHQPVRHRDEAIGTWQHGFVNVLVASVAAAEGERDDIVRGIVEETDADAFSVTATAARWRDVYLPGSAVRRARRNGFLAFGSCDVDEPIEALVELGWLGDGS